MNTNLGVVEETSHYLQAHALLNLQLIHSNTEVSKRPKGSFRIYSPLDPSPHASPSPSNPPPSPLGTENSSMISGELPPPAESPSFTSEELLSVMERLTDPAGKGKIGYFELCREIGAANVDEMVRGRVLELRWTPTVTPEGHNLGEGKEVQEGKSEKEGKNLGPVLLPTTPILGYAMRAVLREWRSGTSAH